MTVRADPGQGSVRSGAGHWWAQRASAAALVPLALWLGASLIAHGGADHAAFAAWVARPWNAALLTLALATAAVHFKVGADAVIDDYVRSASGRRVLRALSAGAAAAAAAVGIAAVLWLALGPGRA